MLKIIIAEDEKLTRNYLRDVIPQLDPRFSVTAVAGNGKEALEMVHADIPDIVFIDIKMPIMDGLDLCDILNREYPEIQKVIISGYDDFSFAQRAIETNVKEYLLKPIDNQKIKGILEKLYSSKKAQNRNQAQNQYESTSWMYAQYYQATALGLTTQLNACVRLMNQTPTIEDFLIVVFHLLGESDNDSNTEDFVSTLLDFTKAHGAFYFGDAFQSIIILCPIISPTMVQATLSELMKYLCDHNFPDLHYGVASGNGTDTIKETYKTARTNLIISFSKDDPDTKDNNQCDFEGQPYDSAHILSITMVDNTLASMHSASSCHDYFALRNEIARLLQLMDNLDMLPTRKELFVQNILSYHFPEIDSQSINSISNICNNDSPSESRLQNILSILQKDVNHANNDISIIEKAKSYILDHYSSAISLNDVAEWVGVSPKYLSNLFLKDAEGSYIKFLTNIRLEVATNMLKSTPSLKLSEIGRAVGYQNDKYFMKVFRKYYGATPSQFKQHTPE